MSLNEIIAEAIDCPMMDCKNVADIIAGYCQYNILEEAEIKYVKIEANGIDYQDETMYLFDGEYFYVLDFRKIVEFEKGKPGHWGYIRSPSGGATKDKFHPHEPAVAFPSQYLFTKSRYSDTIYLWKIVKRYNTFECFNQAYHRDISKWSLLLDNPLLLDDRSVEINYCGYNVYRSRDEEGEDVDLTDKKEGIYNLWDDWEFFKN
jgi:hypothetical protein